MSRALGVDFGTRRVGLAISDGLGLVATPLLVVPRDGAIEEIARVVQEEDVGTIVVGLPTGLGGEEGTSAAEARGLAGQIHDVTGIEVVLVDERFTSRMAERKLVDTGMKRRQRRETVDKLAAAIFLQDYLDAQR